MPSSPPPTPTHRRAITNGPVTVGLPAHLGGPTPIRFDTDALIAIELELDDLLDRHNARLEAAGDEPFASVWEALEELTGRYPLVTMRVLLTAGLPALDGKPVPMSVLNDPALGDALMEALSIAFGTDPAELPQEVAEDPTVAGGDAGGSTGGPSTPSGPARTTSAA